jgi:two-component system alkaline phosphatase synthesis response regulator PhoP
MAAENKTILLIEDEEHISNLIQLNLELEGYIVHHVVTAEEGIQFISRNGVDLVVSDVMLPGISGIEASQKIKRIKPDIPILMVSALGQSTDRVNGLKSGADDYLSKPFNLEELILRVQKLVERFEMNDEEDKKTEITVGCAMINFKDYTITSNNRTHSLTAKEIGLLSYMYEHKNVVLSRQEILENVWGYDVPPSTRTIDNFISSFRKHIEKDPANPRHIISVRGVGYKLSL